MFLLLIFFFFFQAEDGIRDAQESRGLGDVYKRQLLIYGFPLLGTTERLAWWRLTYPKLLTGYGTRHCSPGSPPSLCLLMSTFLSIVVFLRVLSYLLLYSCFSLMIFSPAHLTLFTHMLMTRPLILQLISICLLYTSDAADERSSVDLGGRRIIKKK